MERGRREPEGRFYTRASRAHLEVLYAFHRTERYVQSLVLGNSIIVWRLLFGEILELIGT